MTLLLAAENLVIGHRQPCISPVSFTISKPGIYAIVGANGSGKSTFLKTLLGLLPPISGTFQKKIDTQKYTYVPQVHTVNTYFHVSLRDFILQGYGPQYKNHSQTDAKTLETYLKSWQLAEQADKCFHELSSGQKTRAMIVRALISKPQVLFLDEPLANLDDCCQQQLMEVLHELVQKNNACILMIDHHLDKFKSFITGWFEFTKVHGDPLVKVTFANQ